MSMIPIGGFRPPAQPRQQPARPMQQPMPSGFNGVYQPSRQAFNFSPSGAGAFNPMQGGFNGFGGFNPMQGGFGGFGGFNPMQGGFGGFNPTQGGFNGFGGFNPMQGGFGGFGGFNPMQGGLASLAAFGGFGGFGGFNPTPQRPMVSPMPTRAPMPTPQAPQRPMTYPMAPQAPQRPMPPSNPSFDNYTKFSDPYRANVSPNPNLNSGSAGYNPYKADVSPMPPSNPSLGSYTKFSDPSPDQLNAMSERIRAAQRPMVSPIPPPDLGPQSMVNNTPSSDMNAIMAPFRQQVSQMMQPSPGGQQSQMAQLMQLLQQGSFK